MNDVATDADGTTAGNGHDVAGTARDAGDGAAQQALRRARRAASQARQAASQARRAAAGEAERAGLAREMFARPVRDYTYQALGRPVAVLRAGCQAPLEELGLDELRARGFSIAVTTVDQDSPVTTAAVAGEGTEARQAGKEPAGQDMPILGDLRSIPLLPRSFDILYCVLLLERIPHATLVLDRFLAALRPGGLILLRVRDRNCAAAALDRLLPEAAGRAIWARLHPGEPVPFPAIYDHLASERGIQAYALMRGLVIIRRETARTPPGEPGGLAAIISAARALIAWLSRGRLTNAHDELLYVIRKPEDRFARLV